MNVSPDLKAVIETVVSGAISTDLTPLDGTDFGIFVPAFQDSDGVVKPMLQGYSQMERDLVVSITNDPLTVNDDAKTIAWFGGKSGKDSKCDHGDTAKCGHCTKHTGACRHCTHKKGKPILDLVAPELKYDEVIKQLDSKKPLIQDLAKEQLGVTLLHGHNNEFMFTTLPIDKVAVISGGMTAFRNIEEVNGDETFVPNAWRVTNGQLRVAGGFSMK